MAMVSGGGGVQEWWLLEAGAGERRGGWLREGEAAGAQFIRSPGAISPAARPLFSAPLQGHGVAAARRSRVQQNTAESNAEAKGARQRVHARFMLTSGVRVVQGSASVSSFSRTSTRQKPSRLRWSSSMGSAKEAGEEAGAALALPRSSDLWFVMVHWGRGGASEERTVGRAFSGARGWYT